MLKTSSTESAEPRKGVVRVGSGSRNRAELVGKHKVDKSDDSGSRSGDFDRKFHLRLWYNSCITQLDTQDELINGLIN